MYCSEELLKVIFDLCHLLFFTFKVSISSSIYLNFIYKYKISFAFFCFFENKMFTSTHSPFSALLSFREACRDAHFQQCHNLLCVGPLRAEDPLLRFKYHALEHADTLLLAAQAPYITSYVIMHTIYIVFFYYMISAAILAQELGFKGDCLCS